MEVRVGRGTGCDQGKRASKWQTGVFILCNMILEPLLFATVFLSLNDITLPTHFAWDNRKDFSLCFWKIHQHFQVWEKSPNQRGLVWCVLRVFWGCTHIQVPCKTTGNEKLKGREAKAHSTGHCKSHCTPSDPEIPERGQSKPCQGWHAAPRLAEENCKGKSVRLSRVSVHSCSLDFSAVLNLLLGVSAGKI